MTIVKYITTFYSLIKEILQGVMNLISYAPLWKTMKEKGVSTYALINRFGISSATVDRLKKGGGITTTKLDDLCKILNCRVEEIIEYVPD